MMSWGGERGHIVLSLGLDAQTGFDTARKRSSASLLRELRGFYAIVAFFSVVFVFCV